MAFEPIAIVGQGCVLPGAFSPAELWQLIHAKRCVISQATPADFALDNHAPMSAAYASGFVRDFETVFDPERFDASGIDAAALGPDCTWPLLAASNAWAEADLGKHSPDRIGVIVGNLGYPSQLKSAYAHDIWKHGATPQNPYTAFNASYPAHIIARHIGATGPVISLDAACASSLYALEIACRKLQARQIDAALVGAINAADNLTLHIGFDALQALSPSRQSRPFHRHADGLVPSEGAAAMVLKRYSDVDEGETVHGVIRGIGLSNDGRRKGLLAPSSEGQVETIRRAWQDADLSPSTIDFLECHATGTPVGDAVELTAVDTVFKTDHALPIGSLKANLGHLITAAGLASVLKITQAMATETLPPMPHIGPQSEALKTSGQTLQTQARAWLSQDGVRRAGVSNFGFGGNNAHLIIDQHVAKSKFTPVTSPAPRADIVIVSAALIAGQEKSTDGVIRQLMNAPPAHFKAMIDIGIDTATTRTPPNDLNAAEPQQLALLHVAKTALAGVPIKTTERCGVFASSNISSEFCRFLVRARTTEEDKDAICPPLEASNVLGAMANIAANRITLANDIRGRGFTILSDSHDGLSTLDVALTALHSGQLDIAIIASAQLPTDTPSTHAKAATGLPITRIGHAASLALMHRSDAETHGCQILGSVTDIYNSSDSDRPTPSPLEDQNGNADPANLIFDIAAAALLAKSGYKYDPQQSVPNLSSRPTDFTFNAAPSSISNGGSVTIKTAKPSPTLSPRAETPYLFFASAPTRRDLTTMLQASKNGGTGPCRIAIIADCPEELESKKTDARAALLRKEASLPDTCFFAEGHPAGELAFVFTGSAAGYPRMGRSLLQAFPEAVSAFKERPSAQALAYTLNTGDLSTFDQLCGVTLFAHAQAHLLTQCLNIKPTATLGVSLGEALSLFVFGAWDTPEKLVQNIKQSGMYDTYLGGEFETAREAWGTRNTNRWANLAVKAPLARVQHIVETHPLAEITIIYSEHECMIGGPSDVCADIARQLGPGASVPIGQSLTVHARAMQPFAETWRRIHTRATATVPNMRFYTNATNSAYHPTRKRVADMLTRQAVQTIDFPATIRRAYDDGVRSFIEIGPRDTLTRAIEATLKDRPHMAIATDRIGIDDTHQLALLTAKLFTEGHSVNMDWLDDRFNTLRAAVPNSSQPNFSLHRPISYPLPQFPHTENNVMNPIENNTAKTLPFAPTRPAPRYPSTQVTTPCPDATAQNKLQRPKRIASGLTPLERRAPTGQNWDWSKIAAASTGPISDLFGPSYKQQDDYDRVVRLPSPPLLFVDAILGLNAEPGVESEGTIWTQTDTNRHAWIHHAGLVRPGPLIECGQADLTLISYMGADFKNQNERVYRLLGCEITFHDGGLPPAGGTLTFQIEIIGHASLGATRLFFFQYDAYMDDRLVFSVRNGQAGFFTDDELNTASGLSWDPLKTTPPTPNPDNFIAAHASKKQTFSAADVNAYRNGDPYACFGEGFERTAAHCRTPRPPKDKLALLDSVAAFEPHGGPWKRGYLRATAEIQRDNWLYEGHFHNDPCMPGTLMAEAAIQALEFHAASLGLTIERDGYVFEPLPSHTAQFICRGQVIPDTDHTLSYEVFIDKVIDGDEPEIHAALLVSCDGRKVFLCPHFALRLRRSWPAPNSTTAAHYIGPNKDVRGDYGALIACADGAPSEAFGPMYARFDAAGNVPRLPRPPYHMMSRITDVSASPGDREIGATITSVFDIDPDAWFFDCNDGVMPASVLSEVALQPCGWLASHCGFALDGGSGFRNLQGSGHILRSVRRDDVSLEISARLSSTSKVGSMIILGFDLTVGTHSGDAVVALKTQFGFFPRVLLAQQSGLPISPHDRELHDRTITSPALSPYLDGAQKGQLRMLDEIDMFDPIGGRAGLGVIRARQTVDPYAWYFKSHFFQDPVQPGSLGLDALVQSLHRAVQLKNLIPNVATTKIETIAEGAPIQWSYRGQVTPDNGEIVTVVEITDISSQLGRTCVTAYGSLWCDGRRIYEMAVFSIAFSEG